MTIQDLLAAKRAHVKLSRDDLFTEQDSPGWKERHPLGPVHIQIVCKCCNEIVADDLREYGWLEQDSYWSAVLVKHLIEAGHAT